MEQVITLAVLAGTSRQKRESIKAVRWVASRAEQRANMRVIIVDPAEFTFAGDGNDAAGKDPRYTEIVRQADAFYIVTPEYNHSFPGSLKRMLDSEYDLYRHKPVALAGCSNGRWGGVRVCEALLLVVHRLGMPAIQAELYFPKVQTLFTESGDLLAEHQAYYDRQLAAALDELQWYATRLKANK